jgi:hypothetical protein
MMVAAMLPRTKTERVDQARRVAEWAVAADPVPHSEGGPGG